MDATLKYANDRELLELLKFSEEAVAEAKAELSAVRAEIARRAGA